MILNSDILVHPVKDEDGVPSCRGSNQGIDERCSGSKKVSRLTSYPDSLCPCDSVLVGRNNKTLAVFALHYSAMPLHQTIDGYSQQVTGVLSTTESLSDNLSQHPDTQRK